MRKWFFCETCVWFDEPNELCNHYPEPVPTVAGRQCSLFSCICGGDWDEGEHTDCMQVEVVLDN